MSSNAELFATTVLAAFRAAGHYTDQEVSDAGGPSTTTMTNLRKVARGEGVMPEPRGDTYKRIDRAAQWAAGSARALWQGGVVPEAQSDQLGALRKEAGIPPRSPEEVRAHQRRLRNYGRGPESFMMSLADRILEVEERLDTLEQRLGLDGGYALAADDQGDIDAEQDAPQEP